MAEPAGDEDQPFIDSTITALRDAIAAHHRAEHIRSAQAAELQLANEYIKLEAWDEAIRVLRPLWQGMIWRKEGWWDLAEAVSRLLLKVAECVGDRGTMLAIDWELMNSTFPQSGPFDLRTALDHVDNSKGKPAVVLREQDLHTILATSFAFDQKEARVGEPCKCQLTVTSYAAESTAPLVMDEIKILFETSLKPITIRHDNAAHDADSIFKDGTVLSKVDLHEEELKRLSQPSKQTRRGPKNSVLVGTSHLIFPAQQTRVFEFSTPLKEAESARALSATFSMSAENFDLDYIVTFDKYVAPGLIWHSENARKRIMRADSHTIDILPKPPKMDISFPSLKEQYYTDEGIGLELDVYNGEEEDVIANLYIEIASMQAPDSPVAFNVELPSSPNLGDAQDADETDNPANIQLGRIAASESFPTLLKLDPIQMQSAHEIMLRLTYTLASDPDTRISRTQSLSLHVRTPFEADYDFSPRRDERPWPSYSDPKTAVPPPTPTETSDITPQGITQKWALTARYRSLAHEPILIEGAELIVNATSGSLVYSGTLNSSTPPFPNQVAPKESGLASFDVLIQKLSLEQRNTGCLSLSLSMTWRRIGAESSNTTLLPIPDLLVGSMQPRVLSSATPLPPTEIDGKPAKPIKMTYTIENPSMHFLTFSAVMESSPKFTFEGPKSAVVEVLPLSKRDLEYTIYPKTVEGQREGRWLGVNLTVTDRYFMKVLQVLPGEGMRRMGEAGREGVGVWLPAEDEERLVDVGGGEGET